MSTNGPVPRVSGRKSRRSTRTGNASPRPISSLALVTDPRPPGVTSCDCTSSVSPRMRRCVALRSDNDVCRSSTMALPRSDIRDSPQSADNNAMGESGGRWTLNELEAVCATAMPIPAARKAASLLDVNMMDSYLSGLVVDIAGTQFPLQSCGERRALLAVVHKRQRQTVFLHLDSRSCSLQQNLLLHRSP